MGWTRYELMFWPEMAPLVLLAFGMTYVLTGSVIGYWLRVVWCLALSWSAPSRYFWAIMRCPPCNAWWTGFAVGLVFGDGWLHGLQLAFTVCGLTAIVQHWLGGNGLAPDDEDFDALFGGSRGKTEEEN